MKTAAMIMVLMFLVAGPVRAEQTKVSDVQHKITVSGEAAVYVKPDKILINCSVETLDKDIIVAKQKNNSIVKKSLAAIKDLGVPEKDIQTSHLSIDPRYEDGKDKLTGYLAKNTFIVRLTNPGKLEECITRVLQSGVNSINGIEFQTTELKKYREEARELALKAAKEKAVKMAAVLGQSVGEPVQINEGFSGSNWYAGNLVPQIQSYRIRTDSLDSDEISDTIALGKIPIRANVNVTFELKKKGRI